MAVEFLNELAAPTGSSMMRPTAEATVSWLGASSRPITVHPGVSGQTNQARPDARMGPFRPRLGSPRWTWIRAGVQARQDEPDVWPCPDEARSRMPGCSEGSKPDAQMSRQPGWSPSGFVSGLPGCFLLAQTSGHLGHLGIWPDLKYMSVLQI